MAGSGCGPLQGRCLLLALACCWQGLGPSLQGCSPLAAMTGTGSSATLACMDEHVVLERCQFSGKFCLLSLISHERAVLPDQDWELEFHQGLAYVASDEATEWASKFFTKPVYKDPGGSWTWQEKGADGGTVRIDAADQARSYAPVWCQVGTNIAERRVLSGWKTKLACEGSTYWFRVQDLVKAVGFSKPPRKPWSAIHNKAWGPWDHSLDQMFLPKALRKAAATTTTPEDDRPGWKILDEPTLSAQGLLALLGKFARMPSYLGGLKDGDICARSMLLFHELVKRAAPPFPACMLVEPCPRLPAGSWPVTLPLLADCSIDVGQMIAAGRRPGACKVVQDLAKEWADSPSLRLPDFLAALLQNKARWPLFGQLVICIADRLEQIWDEELQGTASKQDLELDMQCVDHDGLTRLEVSRELVRYWMASSQLCSKGRYWAMSTDDSNFAGKHRKLTALINPENSGIWLPPQVFMYKSIFPDPKSSTFELFMDASEPEQDFMRKMAWSPKVVFLFVELSWGCS